MTLAGHSEIYGHMDVSELTELTSLYAETTQLTGLDVSNNTALTSLYVWSHQLTSLDVSSNTALTGLVVGGNQLTSLDVTNNAALIELDVNYTQLTSLDVSNNTALIELRVNNNRLTSLDVSNNTALTWLWVTYNQMTEPNDVIGWENIGLTLRPEGATTGGNFIFWPQGIGTTPSPSPSPSPEPNPSPTPTLTPTPPPDPTYPTIPLGPQRTSMDFYFAPDLNITPMERPPLTEGAAGVAYFAIPDREAHSLFSGLAVAGEGQPEGVRFYTVFNMNLGMLFLWVYTSEETPAGIYPVRLIFETATEQRVQGNIILTILEADGTLPPGGNGTEPSPSPSPAPPLGGGFGGGGRYRPDRDDPTPTPSPTEAPAEEIDATEPEDPPEPEPPDYPTTNEPPGVPLDRGYLDQITDTNSAVSAFDSALDSLLRDSPDGRLSEDDLSTLAAFAEHAIAHAASMHVNNVIDGTNQIDVNRPNLQNLRSRAGQTRAAIERQLAQRGYRFNREISENVSFIISNYDNVAVNVYANATDVPVDRVFVLTPYYDLSFTRSFIAANTMPTGGTATDVTRQLEQQLQQQAARAALESAPSWLPRTASAEPQPAAGFVPVDFDTPLVISTDSFTNSPRTFNVSFNRPVQESVRLSVTPISGETSTQALRNTATGEIRASNLNRATGNLESRINTGGSYVVVQNALDFADIQNRSREMQSAIRTLASQGVISGMAPGEFAPDNPITRAQVAALVTNVLDIGSTSATSNFNDVRRADWFFMPVSSVYRQNLMSGTGAGAFSPNVNIPRDQLVAITARILRREMNYRNPENPMNYLQEFNDAEHMQGWSLIDLSLAVRENLVTRRADGSFAPGQQITRGEAAIILYRLYRRIW